MPRKPKFPIKIFFKEDEEEWILNDYEEITCNLEWFDSNDSEENAIVTDDNGKLVNLIVKKLEIVKCELFNKEF